MYLIGEEVDHQQFAIATEAGHALRPDSPVETAADALLRRYAVAETKRRLHQPVFRATVMRAYETRCAVCALRHGELLDAAHIVPDVEEQGLPVVTNGLALCKIHHAAYDTQILGIRPDNVVEIRTDLLDEVDGPMLRHGLVERHGQPLMAVPTKRSEQPSQKLLAIRYERFRAAV
ncbi:HNH endonuclease [Rhodococcus sp. X156]|uniref:HNH endonuclease n=1 Tax=Rhodococcus sp. X156 TaxID=2499145 RepID=UPI001F4999D4|nr:HNH endonuclease [Rhodococcus sp. X156]